MGISMMEFAPNDIIKITPEKKFFPKYYIENGKLYKIIDILDSSYYIKNIIVKLNEKACIEYVKIDGKHPNALYDNTLCLEPELYKMPFNSYLKSFIIKLVNTINGDTSPFMSYRNLLILEPSNKG